MTPRALDEMTRHERSNMISLVAQTLDDLAEDAEDRGDRVSAGNATYLAHVLRGCGHHEADLRATEILLEQGISYVAALSDRYCHSGDAVCDDDDHDEDDHDEVFQSEAKVLH
ncbi:hypothetical protein [Rhizobium sp. 2MFCol3.1]|uniref:hypothetical protein n=1 Tax=Rhizobium sp. 2MFCol3.1 TaxID=1246459 RepID=UPI000362B0CC|nr:hypothetical protein [Rhizobium sp. 2MFCol3.1]